MTSRRRKPRSGNGVAPVEAALSEQRKRYAAQATIEALMFSLREQGESALTSADNQRRLSELCPDQLREVVVRLDRMRDRYPKSPMNCCSALGRNFHDA